MHHSEQSLFRSNGTYVRAHSCQKRADPKQELVAVALKRVSPRVEYEAVSCFQINLCDPAAPLHAYLAPADFFFLFPKVKLPLNEEQFSDISNIQRVMIALLKGGSL
jgi:hypothetical protein